MNEPDTPIRFAIEGEGLIPTILKVSRNVNQDPETDAKIKGLLERTGIKYDLVLTDGPYGVMIRYNNREWDNLQGPTRVITGLEYLVKRNEKDNHN